VSDGLLRASRLQVLAVQLTTKTTLKNALQILAVQPTAMASQRRIANAHEHCLGFGVRVVLGFRV
jgi:hypothetical protein